jgi:hypothetical protein
MIPFFQEPCFECVESSSYNQNKGNNSTPLPLEKQGHKIEEKAKRRRGSRQAAVNSIWVVY